jgi:hypothetical protein
MKDLEEKKCEQVFDKELLEAHLVYVDWSKDALFKWEELARSILLYFKMYTQVEHKAQNVEIAAKKIKELELKLEEQKNQVPIIQGGKGKIN